jgi:ABC-type glycerol-3-phosphate transport system substrate-binding protein
MKPHSALVLFIALCASVLMTAGCSRNTSGKNELTVLIRMMPAQERYFTEKFIKEFETQNKCKITIAQFQNQWDIERLLKMELGKKDPQIGLVKTPFEMTHVLVGKGYMKRMIDIEDSAVAYQDLAEYHPLAAGLGFVDNQLYYIPRKLETQVLFYRKSKVAEAVTKFPGMKNEIALELKKRNGFGLPNGYVFESNPAQWDFYDLYVVGWIWAHQEYNGVKIGRMAHRGARYEGTALYLVDRALQMGASQDEILQLTSDKTAEVFLWENQLVSSGIYNPGMWQDPWRGSDIYNGIKDGKVFLAFIQQIDGFLIHGWGDDPGMPTYLPDTTDMGLCIMPQAVSFTLDNGGAPIVAGDRAISSGGWWWGVPKTSPNPQLAYKLARFMTSKAVQAEECTKFGMLPVRKDILSNLPETYNEGWVGEIFKVSVDQIKINMDKEQINTVPLVKEYSQVAQNLIETWYKLCVEYDPVKEGAMDLATMKMRLGGAFLDEQKKILGEDYPK